jgi:hypothetical protein
VFCGLDLKALIEARWLYFGTSDKQPLYIASAGRYRYRQ